MTSAQEAPAVASAPKVHEFTTDLVVHRRHAAADGVVALDLVDPQGDDLPAWEPGAHIDLLLDEGLVRQYSLCGDPRDAKTWRVGVLLDPDEPRRLTPRPRATSLKAAACESEGPATTLRSSTHRDICSSPAASGSPRSSR